MVHISEFRPCKPIYDPERLYNNATTASRKGTPRVNHDQVIPNIVRAAYSSTRAGADNMRALDGASPVDTKHDVKRANS